MAGFYGYFGNAKSFKQNDDPRYVNRTHQESNFFVQSQTVNKFMHDKIFFSNEEYFIITDGVIFNIDELLDKYSASSFDILCFKMYELIGETFYNEFTGSFSGLFLDKRKEVLLIFTDHIGDKPIFYIQKEEVVYFSSTIINLTEQLNTNNIRYVLDMAGAYSILSYGYMLSDITFIEGVKRLNAGKYLRIEKGVFTVNTFHRFEYRPNYKLCENEIIEIIDKLFDNAIALQVNKNKEYGYTDFVALSAGLDSRMTTYAIYKQFKKPIINFTYSPIGFHDELTSKKIVSELNNSYIYQSNNNGDVLYLIDESIKTNEGLFPYFGSAVLYDFFAKLNTNNIGIIHSGQIGDVIVGTFCKKIDDAKSNPKFRDAYSSRFLNKFNKYFDFDKYFAEFEYSDIFSIYNRGFSGVNSGAPLVFQQFAETFSPFCDKHFMEFCLSVPLEKRMNHFLYDKWLLKKYPNAAKYLHNGNRIIGKKIRKITLVEKYYHKVIRKIKYSFSKNKSSFYFNTVTPVDKWYNENIELKNYLDGYFNENINVLSKYSELYDDCKTMYTLGTGLEKIQVITLLGVMKLFFRKHE